MQKRNHLVLLFLSVLLLTACSASKAAGEKLEGEYIYSSDGNYYSTDGNVWYASSGDVAYYYTDELDSVQLTPYATDGNVDADSLPEVHVSNVDELLAAIAPERVILLAPGEYNLSDASPAFYDYCYFRPTVNYETGESERELALCNLWDCVIASESGSCADVRIVNESRTAAVLKIESCYALQLRGLTLGHTDGSICSAAVINLEKSGSVYIDDCELYGCGTMGVCANNCWGVTLTDTLIRDCSYCGVEFNASESIMADHVTFRSVGDAWVISLADCDYVSAQDCSIESNLTQTFLYAYNCNHAFLNDLSFENNSFSQLFDLCGGTSLSLWRCNVNIEQYARLYYSDDPEAIASLDGEPWL